VVIGQTVAEIWRFFKMAAICHLEFLKVRNSNGSNSCAGSEGQFAPPCQMLW